MKQLPNSPESEQALIWSMLIDDKMINLVDLEQDDFYNTTYWKIFNLIKQIKSKWKTVDLVVVKEYLDNKKILDQIWGMSFLIELVESTPNSRNWKQYRDIIKETSDRRKIITYARQIEEMGYREDEEMTNILWQVENISDYIFDLKPSEAVWDTIGYVNSFEEMKDTVIARKGMLWYKTVFPLVDKFTKWQIPGKVTTLVAYSNVWKSKVSYSYVSDFLKQGKKVMYISLEVDQSMLFSNILANYYNKNYYDVLKEDFYYEMQDFENLEIYDSLYKLEDIKNVIKARQPDIVFIDFIQNIQASWTETEKMTKVAQELQQLAITTWVSLFNLSQANNDSRFKDWSDIQPKWSWAIFASTDVLFALNRDNWQLFLTISKNKYWPAFKKFLLMPDETFSNFWITAEFEEQDNNFKL